MLRPATVALTLLLLLGAQGCGSEAPKGGGEVRPVRTVVIDPKPIDDDRQAVGEIRPRQAIYAIFQVERTPGPPEIGKTDLRLKAVAYRSGRATGPNHVGQAPGRQKQRGFQHRRVMRGNQTGNPGTQAHTENRNVTIPVALQPTNELSAVQHCLSYGLDRTTEVGAKHVVGVRGSGTAALKVIGHRYLGNRDAALGEIMANGCLEAGEIIVGKAFHVPGFSFTNADEAEA